MRSVNNSRPVSGRFRASRGSFSLRQLLPKLLCLTALGLVTPLIRAADPIAQSAGFQTECIAIRDATIIPRPGERIEKGTIVIRRGIVESVGPDLVPPPDARVIDGTNLFVYAGLIDCGHSDLWDRQQGPREQPRRTVDAARYALAGTPPDGHRGLHPEYRLESHLAISKERLAALHQSGITLAQAMRVEPIVGGRSCVVALSGAPPRESVLPVTGGLTIDLSPPPNTSGENRYPATPMGAVAHLRQALLDSRRNALHRDLDAHKTPGIPRPVQDEVLEELQPLLEGKLPAILRVDSVDRIDQALDFAAEFELHPVLFGAKHGHQRIERLKQSQSPVILELTFGESPEEKWNKEASKSPTKGELPDEVPPPQRVRDDQLREWKEVVGAAAKLNQAGIPFGFTSHGLKDGEFLSQVRKAMQQGLSHEAALAALTTHAAEILGLADRAGSLDPGRFGNAVVMTHPFQEAAAKVRYVLVDGYVYEYSKEKPTGDEDKPASPEAAANLAGTWNVTIRPTETSRTTGSLSLTAVGSRLEGQFTSEQGAGRVVAGRAFGDELSFRVEIGAGDKLVELRFEGRRLKEESSERLEGTLTSAFGSPAQWSAVRESKAAPATPPAPPQAAAVAPSPGPGGVQLALEPDDEGTSTKAQAEPPAQPSELWTDRRRRAWSTGGNLLLRGGTILPITGPPITGASILVRDGKIAAIGTDLSPEEGLAVIDVSGWCVMPGMVDTHSHIMISPGRGDVNEYTNSIVCEVRVGDVLGSEDVREYRAVAGGLTTARLLHGSANTIGGQHAVIKLRVGQSAQEHLIADAPPGVKFALGENVKAKSGRFPNSRLGVEATIKRAFYEALEYRRQWDEYERARAALPEDAPRLLPPRRDLRLETLVALLNGDSFIHSHCYRADEILMLLRTADELGIRVRSLQHVLEGYKVAPEIASHGASCSTFADWWAYKHEAFDATPFNTSALLRAGINVVIKSDDPELMRHMNHEAAKSLRYGNMPPADALRMVTINAARELGLDDRIGSIEVGKDADFAVFNAHPLNSFARCEMTIIDGEVVFRRDAVPSAMSPDSQLREVRHPDLSLAPDEVRERVVVLPESRPGLFAIVGAAVHPLEGPVIENGIVVVEDDRIAAVGAEIDIPEGAVRIDAAGLHLYPGLIDAGTTLGLHEIRKVRETNDENEIGRLQPDLRAGIAVNAESELIPVARAGGITLALAQPAGGLISGQSSLVQTAGWTSESMVREMATSLRIQWPTDVPSQEELDRFVEDAKIYEAARAQWEQTGENTGEQDSTGPSIVRDPRFEAMRPYIRGDRPVFVEAQTRKEIAGALNFAAKYKLRIVLTGATDAWKLADVLAERGIPCIVGPTLREPTEAWDTFDAPYANPGRLLEAGVPFCIRSNNPSNSRNVAFEAAIAVAYGLPEQEGLKAITINAAKILGIADDTGSIETGKRADLILTDGSPLQHATQIKATFVSGVPYPPESRQTRLYEKYLQRLAEPANRK